MAKKQGKNNVYIMSIFAIVAIVGIVMLILYDVGLSNNDDIIGETIKIKTPHLSDQAKARNTETTGIIETSAEQQ